MITDVISDYIISYKIVCPFTPYGNTINIVVRNVFLNKDIWTSIQINTCASLNRTFAVWNMILRDDSVSGEICGRIFRNTPMPWRIYTDVSCISHYVLSNQKTIYVSCYWNGFCPTCPTVFYCVFSYYNVVNGFWVQIAGYCYSSGIYIWRINCCGGICI